MKREERVRCEEKERERERGLRAYICADTTIDEINDPRSDCSSRPRGKRERGMSYTTLMDEDDGRYRELQFTLNPALLRQVGVEERLIGAGKP